MVKYSIGSNAEGGYLISARNCSMTNYHLSIYRFKFKFKFQIKCKVRFKFKS